jgi:hypothetical protein
MLAHAYPGNSFRDWLEMPIPWLRAHADALPELRAADQMRAIQANSFAWMDKGQQREITRGLQRAGPKAESVKLSPAEWAQSVAMMGIEIIHESA